MSEIKKLSDWAHARTRLEMYLGSRDPHTQVTLEYREGEIRPVEVTWTPAVFTAFREILDNAMDEVVGHGFGNEIHIRYDPTAMSFVIKDNGRGIPISFDKEHKQHAATMAVSETKAGRNFGDRGQSRGLNGVGAAIVNFTSEYFTVDIHREGQHFNQRFSEGNNELKVEQPIILPSGTKKTGTEIAFKLSPKVYRHLILPEDFVRDRVYEAALCYPNVRFYFNGKQIKTKGVEKDLLSGKKPIVMTIERDKFISTFWLVPGFFEENGEHSHSLVNAIPMFNGGVHVDAFRKGFFSGLLKAMEPMSKRKKLTPNRSDIGDGMLIYNITQMEEPSFDSQSKSRLINDSVGKIISSEMDDPDFFKSVIRKNSEWIEEIYERCALRTMKKDLGDLSKSAKANKRLKIVELEDASGTARMKCTLLVCEGKSAVSGLLEARNPELHGALPLRGKIMNVYGRHLTKTAFAQHLKKVSENDTLKKISAALGLAVGQKAVRSSLRYGKIFLATDADPDGANIAALLVNYFYQLWPELFDPENPFVYIFQTPFIIAKKGKQIKYWYADDYDDFDPKKYKDWEITRAKGLAALERADWETALNDPRVIPVVDKGDLSDCLDLLFSPDADERKKWLE